MVGCDGHNECSAQATPSGAGKHALALASLRLIAGAAGWRDDSLPGTVTPPCETGPPPGIPLTHRIPHRQHGRATT